MLGGIAAGAIEAAVTMPFEVCKMRQQMGYSNGLLSSMREAATSAGSWRRGLYVGLPLQAAQNGGKVGIRFFAYDGISSLLPKSTLGTAISGFSAGFLEALIWVTPCERVKVLRINHGAKSMMSVLSAVRSEGLTKLWTGAGPTVLRNSTALGVRFTLYETILERYCSGTPAIAGAAVGILGAVFSNPSDVVKTRMQSVQGKERYSSFTACVKSIFEKEGLMYFFRTGLVARVLKIGLGQAVIFQVVAWLR